MLWAMLILGAFAIVFGPGYACEMYYGREHPVSDTAHCLGISLFFGLVLGGIMAVVVGGMAPEWSVFWVCAAVPPLVVLGCAYRSHFGKTCVKR